MGNDINIKLNDGGSASASFWGNMMSRICADLPTASFREKPSNVKNVNGEYYVDGTYSKTSLTKTGDSADETTASCVQRHQRPSLRQNLHRQPMLAAVNSITTRYTNPGPAVFRPRGLCCNRRQTDIPAPASPGHPLPPGQPCIHRLSFTTPELPFIPDSPAALISRAALRTNPLIEPTWD